MYSTASGLTVISVQDQSYASPVNLSSAIVDLNLVIRRRSIENVRSADAVVTGKMVRTLSSEIQRNVGESFYFTIRSNKSCHASNFLVGRLADLTLSSLMLIDKHTAFEYLMIRTSSCK